MLIKNKVTKSPLIFKIKNAPLSQSYIFNSI